MSLVARQKAFLNHNPAEELLSVEAYENGLFYMVDGDEKYIGFSYLSPPLPGVDAASVEKLFVLLSQDFPEGTFLQTNLWASPDIELFIDNFLALRKDLLESTNPEDDILKQSILDSVEFYRQGTKKPIEDRNNTLVRDIIVLISVKIPVSGEMGTEKEIKKIHDIRRSTEAILENTGFATIPVDADRYLRVMGSILNWGENPSWAEKRPIYDPTKNLKSQVFDYDTVVDRDKKGIWLGKKRVRLLTSRYTPEYASLANAIRYLGDPKTGSRGVRENLLITLNIYFPNIDSVRSKMGAKKQAINFQAFGPVYKFNEKLGLQKDSYDALFATLDDGDNPISCYLGFTLFCDDDESSDAAVGNLKTFYREFGLTVQEDSTFSLPLFTNNLPFGPERKAMNDLRRYKTMGKRHAIQLMPLLGDAKGSYIPALILISRNGQPMGVDLFDSESNLNGLIAAQSGGGKSFFVNQIIMAYRSMGAEVWVIDQGYSYKKINRALNGDFIDFQKGSNICLNPFETVQDYDDEADMLLSVIVAMAAPSETLTDYQMGVLSEVLKDCWNEHATSLTIDFIAKKLIEQGKSREDLRISDIGSQLFRFTTKGEFGKYFNGKNNVSFNNPFTVLELENLKTKPHLQAVVLLMLIMQIQRAMFLKEDLGVKSLLIVDEAWDLLTRSEGVARFIEDGYRRFRKVNASAIIITQSVNDIYASKAGEAIAANSENIFLLGQKAETIESLKQQKRLDLSDGSFEVMKTLHTIKGKYSGIFVYNKKCVGIGRLIVNRFNQLLFSTTAEEVQAINMLEQQGFSTTEAINEIIKRENANV